jgi:uncharacterized lipoprotein YajG
MKKLLLPLAIVFALASCSTTRTGTLATPAYAPKAEINPIRANVEIDMTKKLIGESVSSYFLIFQVGGGNKFADGMSYSSDTNLSFLFKARENKTKSAAAYNAIQNSGADIIVHPNYIVEIHDYLIFKQIKVKVTGYAGYFKKFYQKEYKDNEEVQLKLDLSSKK